MNKIYIVIPVMNQVKETLRCLHELETIQTQGYKILTVVVDNASRDGTAQAVKRKFPKVKIIVNKENLGFGKAVNRGLKVALRDQKMELVLILNNDTFLDKTFLLELVKSIRSDDDIGLIAPALRYHIGNKVFFGLEGHLDRKTFKAKHRNVERIKNRKLIISDFVSAACILVKRKVFEKAGLFDERYFLYLEDVDFCLQAKKNGFKLALDPNIIIGHKTSASIGNPLFKIPHSFRSNLLLISKWTPTKAKPYAIFHTILFYPWLFLLWSWHGIKRDLRKRWDNFLSVRKTSGKNSKLT